MFDVDLSDNTPDMLGRTVSIMVMGIDGRPQKHIVRCRAVKCSTKSACRSRIDRGSISQCVGLALNRGRVDVPNQIV